MPDRSDWLVYLACADPREVHVSRLSADGRLAVVQVAYVPGLDVASPISMPLALSPDRRFLYAALREQPYPLCTFAVDPTDGRLTLVGSSTVPGSMPYLAVDRSSSHLLCASGPDGFVVSVAIGHDGVADGVREVTSVPPRGHCVLPSPYGPYAYAISVGADHVVRFLYDAATGHFDEPRITQLAEGSHPRHLTFSPDGSTLYLIHEHDATIAVLGVDRGSGELTVERVVRTQPEGFDGLAADIHVTPDGRYLYATERMQNVISGFAVDRERATLTPVGEWPTENWTRSFAITPDGALLLAPGQYSNHLTVFRIDPATGALDAIARHPTAGNPSWIEITPVP